MRFLQAAIIPLLAITFLAFSGEEADAAKGAKKTGQKISGKVVSVNKGKNGKQTVTVKVHHHKKKTAAAGVAGAAGNVAAAAGKAGAKKGKGHTKHFTVDNSTKITYKGGKGAGAGAVAAAGKGKGKGKGAGGAGAIHVGDQVNATVSAQHHASHVEVAHSGKGKGKKKA